MPGETDAAHEIGLDDGAPIGVGDFGEGFGAVDSQVVDENVDLGKLGDERVGYGRVGKVTGESLGVGEAASRISDAGFRASVHDHARAFRGKRAGNRETNAGGRARNQGEFIGELKVHESSMIEVTGETQGRSG